jgi:cytochrome P450
MSAKDMKLYHPATFDRGFPHEYFAYLRREDPVHWQEPAAPGEKNFDMTQGFWALSRYDDLVHVSRHPKTFSSWRGLAFLWDMDEEMLQLQRMNLLNLDPPEHVRYRGLLNRGFTPRMVRMLEPRICAYATRVVDAVAKRGECDFVTDLAAELPLILICELVGIPDEDRHKIFNWSNAMIGHSDPEYGDDPALPLQAATELYMYAAELAQEKLDKPDDTLISVLLHGDVDGHKLTTDEFNQFMVLLSVAGNETTRNATSQGMRLLDANPDQFELLKSDLDRYLPGAIEEIVRCAPPVMQFRRTATADTEIRGVKIRENDKVVMYYSSANRDEDIFENPNKFDITRNPNPHVSFGIGEHFCLGANLARMQLTCIFKEVFRRLPDIHVVQPPRLLFSNFIDGIKEMRVEFTPER